jgi:hypothetical protein
MNIVSNVLFFLSSSSSKIQGLGHWPVPASMNSTFCVVYQDLFFLWACTKESAQALVFLSSLLIQLFVGI